MPRIPKAETEYRRQVRAALEDGKPRERDYPSERDARLAGRRLRNAGNALNARLTLRFTPAEGGQTRLTFTATKRG